ncbi:SKI2 subunit of superkiller complex protein-like, partial [Grus americana]|uniref:SKI2 subunit of superkiller complex protein-like n=1 Tax=Grus americana TaxID=9117 RepID=UPI0024077852
VSPEGPPRTFTTLVLCEKPPEEGGPPPAPPDAPDAPYPEDLLLTRLFLPEGPCGHALEKLQPGDIAGVTAKTLRVNPEKLLQELRPRPRWADSPPRRPGGAPAELGGPRGGSPFSTRWGPCSCGTPKPWKRPPPPAPWPPRSAPSAASTAPASPSSTPSSLPGRSCWSNWSICSSCSPTARCCCCPSTTSAWPCCGRWATSRRGGAVALGGRLASLLSCHELVLTELLLGNVLAPLRPEESVALLSCMVCPGRGEPPPHLPPPLQEGMERVRAVAQRVGQLQQDCGLSQSVEEFVEQFGFGLVEVVYEWARGMPFADIARLAAVQEGAVVRCIQRLEETCREVRQAARLVGEPALAAKMEAASNMIKRDIVFAASLYTQ